MLQVMGSNQSNRRCNLNTSRPEKSRSLFRNKRFLHNEMFQQNPTKDFTFYVIPVVFFYFSFRATSFFPLWIPFALVYVDKDQDIHKGKRKLHNMKKTRYVHLKYSKCFAVTFHGAKASYFWRVLTIIVLIKPSFTLSLSYNGGLTKTCNLGLI